MFTNGASVSDGGDGRCGGKEGRTTLILSLVFVFGFRLELHDVMSSRRELRLEVVEASADDLCRNLIRDERLEGGELPLLPSDDGSRADWERAIVLGVDGEIWELVF